MSNKREPLKDQDILDVCDRYADNYPIEGRITVNPMAMRRAVEPLMDAARAKDAELIQRLLNALEYVASYDNGCPLPTWEKGYNEAWAYANATRKEVEAAGFKVEDL